MTLSTRAPLTEILRHLRAEPSRTWSVIITVFGDAIVPRGGSVWLGTLVNFLAALDIGDGVVRTAMSRLAADGWLQRRRVGRNSFYHLTGKGRATFRQATEHIYGAHVRRWNGRFELILIHRRRRLARGRRRDHEPDPAVPLFLWPLRARHDPHLQGGIVSPAAGLRDHAEAGAGLARAEADGAGRPQPLVVALPHDVRSLRQGKPALRSGRRG
jgi:hypothetical protein